jgi:hypothetical protein
VSPGARILRKGYSVPKKMKNEQRRVLGQARAATIARLPRLSGAELARSSWAKHIESYADLPEIYQDFFATFLADGKPFPYAVLTPTHERFIHRTSEKLICDFDSEIHVLERTGNSFEAQCYPVEAIS